MSRHTPEPWEKVHCLDLIEGFYKYQIMYAKDRVALICGRTESEQEANAFIVGASLDMLSALRQAHEAINPTDREEISMHEWQGRLQLASKVILQSIRKAEGETDECMERRNRT